MLCGWLQLSLPEILGRGRLHPEQVNLTMPFQLLESVTREIGFRYFALIPE
jgi:hypothetical protein